MAWAVHGEVLSLCAGRKLSNPKNTKVKYVAAFDGRVGIFCTQQPTKNTLVRLSGYTRAGATREECAGGLTPSF